MSDGAWQEAFDAERAESLSHALAGSRDALWDWDITTGALKLNAHWYALRGLPAPAEPISDLETWKRHVHADDLPGVMRALQRHLDGETPRYQAEYRVLSADGRTHWIEDRGSVVQRDGKGRALRMAGLNTEIGTRKDLERALRRAHMLVDVVQRVQRKFIRDKSIKASAETMLEAALEVTGCEYGFIGEVLRDEHGKTYLETHAVSDISWDEHTRAIYANRYRDGMQFRNHDSLFGHTLRTGEALITNAPRSHPASSGTPGGHPPLKSYAGIPVHSGSQLVGMIGLANHPDGFDDSVIAQLEPLITTFAVMVDVQNAERKRALAADRTLEIKRRLRNVTNGIPGAVCQWLTCEGQFRQLVFISAGVRALTGLDPETVQQRPRLLLRAIPASWRRELFDSIRHHARCATPWSREFPLAPNGEAESIWIRVAAQPRVTGHGEIEWNGVLVDITAQKLMEDELRFARDRADAASRAKSAFLATMSHEIRTPIHAMLGYIELLQRSLLQDGQRQQLAIVDEATRSLLGLLDDILDFSRIEAGKMSVSREPVDVQALLRRNQSVWSMAATRGGLELIVDSRLPAQRPVLIDPVRTQQILVNLMSNAIKFTRSGSVRIEADWRPDTATEAGELRFVVTDTGIGIPASVQARIFDPFEQEDAETTRRFGGSGLGLAICRRLAALLGGTLELRSEVGRGTRVLVRLPAPAASMVSEPAAEAPRADAAADAARGELAVLVVEDNETSRALLVCQLEQLGVHATAVADGLSALAEWPRRSYDLILTDCHMPGLDGFELTRSIRRMERQLGSAEVPVIAFTADAFRETEQACLSAGMNDYLAKPVSIAALESVIRRWARRAAEPARPQPETPPPARPPIIDAEQLERVTGGVPWLRTKALSLFDRNLPANLDRLTAAWRARDCGELAAESHSLTGAARTIGASALAEASLALNRHARAQALDAVAAAYQRVVSCAATTSIAVEELLRAR